MKSTSQQDPPTSNKKGTFVSAQATFNPDEFRQYTAEFGLNTAQETELLETMWNIMQGFVELGWGVENVQLAMPELFLDVAEDSNKLLESKEAHIIGGNDDDNT